MCTVTWVFERGGYELFTNRDEQLTRAAATGPVLVSDAAATYLAPTDGEAGGTWISVNEHGTGITLLNNYQVAGPAPDRRQSRGRLVQGLASARDLAEVHERITALDCTRFMGFTVLALHPAGGARVYDWDGERLGTRTVDAQAQPLLVSSSHSEVERVRELRSELLTARSNAAGGLAPELLLDFHRSHEPEPSVYSVCMHRPGVETVSATRVRVSAERVTMSYCAGSPCRTAFGEPVALPRAQ